MTCVEIKSSIGRIAWNSVRVLVCLWWVSYSQGEFFTTNHKVKIGKIKGNLAKLHLILFRDSFIRIKKTKLKYLGVNLIDCSSPNCVIPYQWCDLISIYVHSFLKWHLAVIHFGFNRMRLYKWSWWIEILQMESIKWDPVNGIQISRSAKWINRRKSYKWVCIKVKIWYNSCIIDLRW